MSASMFAATFAALYASHQLADHVLGQTDHQAAHKAGKGWTAFWAMAGHVGLYTGWQTLALWSLALIGAAPTLTAAAAGLAVSAGTHAFIDRRWFVQWILRATGSPGFAGTTSGGISGPYLADQALHVGCLFVSALLVGGLS